MQVNAKSPDSNAVHAYFEAEAASYAREREQQYSFACQKRLVLELLDDVHGRVLDVGCGPAVMEEALLARGLGVWGIDASAEMIEHGKARLAASGLAGRCSLAVGDATRIAAADGFYDAVLAMGVLEYLPDYRPALREMHRVLRPGGTLVLTLPNRISPYHAVRGAYLTARKLMHREALKTNRCIPWQLDRQLAEHGLRKLDGLGCNFILFPLHERLPRASTALNRALWPLARTPLGPLAGSQYIVKARRG
jgi:2-polyprenyl-6-hydroxyphenyl methylase/3-demethylubiquinone-9 3-methyltransferase